jgi:hypothetical protein
MLKKNKYFRGTDFLSFWLSFSYTHVLKKKMTTEEGHGQDTSPSARMRKPNQVPHQLPLDELHGCEEDSSSSAGTTFCLDEWVDKWLNDFDESERRIAALPADYNLFNYLD